MITKFIHERPINANEVSIDSVGLGAGVVDILRRDNYRLTEIISGAEPVGEIPGKTTYRFKNFRSQMWWNVRQLFLEGKICLQVAPPKLIQDLTSIHYKISGDRVIEVEPKDKIKERIGRSTDAGDAFIYALAPKRIISGYGVGSKKKKDTKHEVKSSIWI